MQSFRKWCNIIVGCINIRSFPSGERNIGIYADFLLREGIPFKGNRRKGILVTINGTAEGHGKCMAFVADMDALPLVEMNNVPYKSIYNGVMHACGHDAQAASLMGL